MKRITACFSTYSYLLVYVRYLPKKIVLIKNLKLSGKPLGFGHAKLKQIVFKAVIRTPIPLTLTNKSQNEINKKSIKLHLKTSVQKNHCYFILDFQKNLCFY